MSSLPPDQGREHHQREGGQDGLVQPEQQRRPAARKAHPPQHLPLRRARHAGGLHHLDRNPRITEQHRARDRRDGVDRARHDRHHRRHPEEQQHRDQVREGRHRLHQVQGRLDHPAQQPVLVRGHPDHQTDHHRERDRETDQGQGEHRLVPIADDQDVRERREREDGEPRPSRKPGQQQDRADGERPGHPEEQRARVDERLVEHPGDSAEEPADMFDQPRHERVDPLAQRHDVPARVFEKPGVFVAQREQKDGGGPHRDPDRETGRERHGSRPRFHPRCLHGPRPPARPRLSTASAALRAARNGVAGDAFYLPRSGLPFPDTCVPAPSARPHRETRNRASRATLAGMSGARIYRHGQSSGVVAFAPIARAARGLDPDWGLRRDFE